MLEQMTARLDGYGQSLMLRSQRQQVIASNIANADTPGYVSPTTGRWIEGRAARREDLKRSGARPWEGFAAERSEAQKRLREAEQKADRKLEAAVRTAFHELPPAQRRALETP